MFVVQGARFGPISFINLLTSIFLLLGLYSFVFKKKIFDEKQWRVIFWILVLHLGYQLIRNIWEGSIYTTFGVQELLLNLLGFLILAGPLYLSVFKLANISALKSSKKKR